VDRHRLAVIRQPATGNRQPATGNRQPARKSRRQRATIRHRLAVITGNCPGALPVIREPRPKESGFRYGAKKPQKSAKNPRSAIRGHRPA